ncbi:DUF1565 domain-containing protein [Nostoc sp. TCL26-01]|uniref:DUF1565 domain-containing protein n=1 Tax=Nostoc sp. TCL26-01 TaxID=2576904 RepID=UPI0015B833E1|nr:DUF1565 domain-containing protein [Nostoc sp. TCL26-01]QLE58068.1 DUF1565 domain-containing protein [Nostoc sp. TCL26-01]
MDNIIDILNICESEPYYYFLRSGVKLISPIWSKHRQLNFWQIRLVSLELARYAVFGLSLLSTVGVTSITILSTSANIAVAQMPLSETTMSQVNVLFVNPSVGDDSTGNGSEQTPLKTITQALRIATPNTVIRLAPGIYSQETGEVFPLMLKPGVSLQGDTSNKGQGITIQGGGQFLSRSFGGQNVTIVGANQTSLSGVTITNTNPRGYGLWIEASNPVITENTFTGNTQDGVSVTGNSTTTITKNYFYRNGANGITIGGTSQAQIRENIFAETGFGINVTQNSAPAVLANQIQNNRSGIIVQGNARPILRNNLIQGSKEDGLVAIAQAVPDLGNATTPGGNEFRNNTRYDINATTAKQIIPAIGNTLSSQRIAGKLALTSQDLPIVNNSQPAATPNTVLQTIPTNGEITFAAPNIPDNTNQTRQRLTPNQSNSQLPPLGAAQIPLAIPRYNQQPPAPIPSQTTNEDIPNNLPSATTRKTRTLPSIPSQVTQLNHVRIDPNTIEFVAPQAQQPEQTVTTQELSWPTNISPSPSRVTPIGDTAILPVPTNNIPLGNTRNMRKVTVPQSQLTGYGGNDLLSARAGVRYRVVVEAASEKEQELVKSLAPGAFSTIWQGRRVMQAGVFSNRYNADEMLKILNSSGLRSIVEPLN